MSNILFISNLGGQNYAGPNYSVPAQVAAQAKIDNVLWFNTNNKTPLRWKEQGLPILTSKEIPSKRLADLPNPFNHPDIVIVEEVYTHRFCRMIKEVQKAQIPYIIIPRSQLTKQGQKRKFFKKWLGNLIYYKQLVAKAAAIQYLTEQEKQNSSDKWNKNSFVLPNGIDLPDYSAKNFLSNAVHAVYIGRLEKYQKGLDILFNACFLIQQDLRKAHFKLDIFGPNNCNFKEDLLSLRDQYKLTDIISISDPIFGKEKIELLKKADIFIMPSRFEGHPMGLIEALAYGLPCVATTGTNMRSEIDKFNAGWTADNTAKSIAYALKKMIEERSQFAQKSANARTLAAQYNWDKIAQDSRKIYEDLIRRNR